MDHDVPEERALARALSRSACRQGATPHRPEVADADDDASAHAGKLKARVGGFDLDATTSRATCCARCSPIIACA